MEKILLDKLKGFLTFVIPCVGFILPQKFEDGFTSGGKFGDESANVLQSALESPYLLFTFR